MHLTSAYQYGIPEYPVLRYTEKFGIKHCEGGISRLFHGEMSREMKEIREKQRRKGEEREEEEGWN